MIKSKHDFNVRSTSVLSDIDKLFFSDALLHDIVDAIVVQTVKIIQLF